ncbi:MAG: outer membrane protein assembly factor, partial [Oligoflexia bacterium]|nr:outer membrane protein assembly factor [Oligoflexia bacterium]
LRTLATKWGWQLSVSGRTDQYRRFSEGRLAEVLLGGTGERFPFEFGRRLFEGSARLTRSFGQSLKHQLSFGWRGYSREYRVGTATGASATPTAAAAAEFRSNYVPRNENAGLVFIGYRAYVPEYRAFLELDSYAVTEDLRLGPDFRAEARVAQPAFGFGSRYFEPAASLDWALSAGGHLWQSSLSVQSRYQPELGYRTPWVNRFAKFEIKDAFPAWGAFRLHARAAAIRRWHDQDRNVEFLGGDDALRGYPSGYLTGSQLAAANLELRSRSLRFKSVHWGTAFFYDVGDAFNAPSELRLHQSVGAGLRIVFPEFNRAALRLDFAMPLERLPDAMPSYFVAKFGQAF